MVVSCSLEVVFWLVNYTQTWSAVPFTVFSELSFQDLREKVIAPRGDDESSHQYSHHLRQPLHSGTLRDIYVFIMTTDGALSSERSRWDSPGQNWLHLCGGLRCSILVHLLFRA